MEGKQFCLTCSIETQNIPSYQNYICLTCAENPLDKDGRSLRFYNVSISGGFEVRYRDTDEARDDHIAMKQVKKRYANEAHFGGIFIQPIYRKNS